MINIYKAKEKSLKIEEIENSLEDESEKIININEGFFCLFYL
jgi:hypothetical protein